MPNIIPLLTIENVAEMIELRMSGWSYARLERKFGVEQHTISKYIKEAQHYGFDYWHPEVFNRKSRQTKRFNDDFERFQTQTRRA